MALQSLGGPVSLMQIPTTLSSAPSYSTGLVIDAADESVAFVFRAPATGSITKVGFRSGNVGTGATVDVRLETVDTSTMPAQPTGTLQGSNTNASLVIGNADDNLWFTVTLTAPASVTKNDLLALVIKQPSAGAGSMTIAGYGDDLVDNAYSMLKTASWAANATGPNMAVTYNVGGTDTYYPMPGVLPSSGINTTTGAAFSSASTPDTIGLRFQLPVAARISGCWFVSDADGGYDVKLVSTAYHQANGTGILASANVPINVRRSNQVSIAYIEFDVPYVITANTNYRLVVEPGATAITIYDFSVATLAHLDAMPGGRSCHLTFAKDPTQDADWTNSNSASFRRPFLGLLMDAFDDGVPALFNRSHQRIGL